MSTAVSAACALPASALVAPAYRRSTTILCHEHLNRETCLQGVRQVCMRDYGQRGAAWVYGRFTAKSSVTESIHIPLPERRIVGATAPGNAPGRGDELDAAFHYLLHLRVGLLASVAHRLGQVAGADEIHIPPARGPASAGSRWPPPPPALGTPGAAGT